jgi:hypothetical protein
MFLTFFYTELNLDCRLRGKQPKCDHRVPRFLYGILKVDYGSIKTLIKKNSQKERNRCNKLQKGPWLATLTVNANSGKLPGFKPSKLHHNGIRWEANEAVLTKVDLRRCKKPKKRDTPAKTLLKQCWALRNGQKKSSCSVFRIRTFLGLQDPDPDP